MLAMRFGQVIGTSGRQEGRSRTSMARSQDELRSISEETQGLGWTDTFPPSHTPVFLGPSGQAQGPKHWEKCMQKKVDAGLAGAQLSPEGVKTLKSGIRSTLGTLLTVRIPHSALRQLPIRHFIQTKC